MSLFTLAVVLAALTGKLYSDCQREKAVVEHLRSLKIKIHEDPKSDGLFDRWFSGWLSLAAYRVEFISSEQWLAHIDKVASLKYVRHLEGMPNTEDLRALSKFENLKTLEISAWGLRSLRGIENLQLLERIYLFDADHLTTLTPLTGLNRLELIYLSLEDSNNLDDPTDVVSTLSNLREFEVQSCNIRTLDGFQNLRNLEVLDIEHSQLQNLDALNHIHSLRTISLNHCHSLLSLSCFKQMDHLEQLGLMDCHSLSNVEGLSRLENLTSLSLHGCKTLRDCRPLTKLKTLKTLNISIYQDHEESEELQTELSEAMPNTSVRVRRRRSITDPVTRRQKNGPQL